MDGWVGVQEAFLICLLFGKKTRRRFCEENGRIKGKEPL